MKKNIIIAIFALLAANFAPMSAMNKGSLYRLFYGDGQHIASRARKKQSEKWGLRELFFGDGKHIKKQAENIPVQSLMYKEVNAPVVNVEPVVSQKPAVIENPADSAAFEVKKESTKEQKPAKEKRPRRTKAQLAEGL